MEAASYAGGLKAPAIDAARAFRAALDAMARPGVIHDLSGAQPPAPMSQAAGTLALTLLDPETPVWLGAAVSTSAVADWIRFHTGAPVVEAPGAARFAFGTWQDMQPIDRFAVGTPEYPDRSATLIVEVPVLDAAGPRLQGPGIESSARLSLPEVAAFQRNAVLFPLGLDFFLTAGGRVAGLPRTTQVEG